uniref:Uncharacterized protein n=1 Tax=Oryza glumipatula TaxID=40148 RepID=A0A0E0A676_9ORYZ
MARRRLVGCTQRKARANPSQGSARGTRRGWTGGCIAIRKGKETGEREIAVMAGEAEDGDGERLRLFVGQVPCSMAEEEILAVDRAALLPTTPPSSATALPCSRFEGAFGSPDDNLDGPATAAEPRGGHGVVHGDGQRRPVGRKAAGPRRAGRRHRC